MSRFVGLLGMVMGLAVGCGGVTVREVAPKSPHALPAITVERLQACTAEFGEQLEPGQYKFHPVVEVDTDGMNQGVEMVGIPDTAPDLASCMRIALGDMAPPASAFNMRRMPMASTNESTVEQRSYIGNPVVIVVVVVEVGEIILQAGAITILFATTVKVVDKAAEHALEAAKRWRPRLTKNRCYDAAAGGPYLWEAMCQSLSGVKAALCWKHMNSNETEKRNLCNSWFEN